jgi:DNA-binding IclR family transcriptional regulator
MGNWKMKHDMQDAPARSYAHIDADRRPQNDADHIIDRARAASRAFDVLEYFRQHGRPARMTHIAQALDIPNSSADDLLKVMVAKGYLTFGNQTKLYSPSYRLFRMIGDISSTFPGLGRVREIENTLQARTGQTVLVAIQEFSMFRIASVAKGIWFDPRRIDVSSRPLARYDDGLGWLPTSNFALSLLASNSDTEIVEVLNDLEQPGRTTNYLPFLERVRAARKRGYAKCEFDCQAEASPFMSYAKPLRVESDMPAMAIGCVGRQREVEPWRGLFTNGIPSFIEAVALADARPRSI